MTDQPAPDVDEALRLGFSVDAEGTLSELRQGPRDPTIRFGRGIVWRATRETSGPATMRLSPMRDGWRVMAWGPGARDAADAVPRLLGRDDDPDALVLPPGKLRDLAAHAVGLRFPRTDSVWPSLLPAICGQKVTSVQAHRAYFGLIARYGEPAPGPGGLRLAPTPDVIAAAPYFELHRVGLEQRRAVTLIRAAEHAVWLERAVTMPLSAAKAHLRSLPGIGVWTAAEVARSALGDPDAVSVGDFHVPDMVCWALAGEPRGSDPRMLDLLEPYRGQRARVVRILERSGVSAPRFGARLKIRAIDDI